MWPDEGRAAPVRVAIPSNLAQDRREIAAGGKFPGEVDPGEAEGSTDPEEVLSIPGFAKEHIDVAHCLNQGLGQGLVGSRVLDSMDPDRVTLFAEA